MMKRLFMLMLLSMFCNMLYAGGGWTKKKGEGYFKLGQWWINSPNYYNMDGNIVGIPRTSMYISSIYGEYGLTDKWTLTSYLPLFIHSQIDNQTVNGINWKAESIQGIGDLNFGIKYGLFQDKAIVIALGLQIGIPSGNSNGGNQEVLQTGDGEFNQMVTVEASHSFYPLPIYLSTILGFNNRTNGFSDELIYGLETGVSWKKFTLILRLNGVNSLQNDQGDNSSYFSIYNNNREYLSHAAELVYSTSSKWGLTIASAGAFNASNILAARTYSAGIFYKF